MVSVQSSSVKKVKASEQKRRRKVKPPKQKNTSISAEKVNYLEAQIDKSTKDKKIKYFMPSKSITGDLITKSLQALQQLTIHYQKKYRLLEEESPIFAEIRCIKIQNSRGNIKFVLPNSTIASTGEVCLITPDLKKGKKVEHEPTIDHWRDIFDKAGVTSVKTILPMRQLRVEYDQFELKRRLLTQHDFIMVDTRVLNHVSHLLGKMFFKKHNMLIPVRINEAESKDIKRAINIGLRTVMLRVNEGATSTVTVGHTAMPQELLNENIMSLIQQLKQKFPGGEANVRSLSLKLPLSLSIPLYITLRPNNTISIPKLKHKKPKHFAVVEGELSTIPGSKVKVAPDGTVHVVKSGSDHSDVDDNEDGEVDEDDKEIMEEE